ncbi:MAG: PaaX family transcriptional regulator C-terminal domain-containing protein [Alphaproteobacteria bacterium]
MSSTLETAEGTVRGPGALLGLEPPRAKSAIVTIFGDSILPRGGACWLSELIGLMADLGLNERVVRTAVFRLVQDGVLSAERIGRRSRYAMTDYGRRQFVAAASRIYAAAPPDRDGRWTLTVLPDDLTAMQRERLERELVWLGFAKLTGGLMGSARGDLANPAQAVVTDAGLSGRCPVFTADPKDEEALATLAARAWNLDTLGAGYRDFVSRFEGVTTAPPARGRDAFVIRTLLIHTYRRALLRDPVLPRSLLPDNWPGDTARRLAARLYRSLAQETESYLDSVLSDAADADIHAARYAES